MTILNRSEVDKNLTWDTSAIFKSKEEARKEANDLLEASLKLKENYEGKLNDFDTIVKAFKEYEDWNYEKYGKEKNDARRHYETIRLLL